MSCTEVELAISEKLYLTMRSLYRLGEFKELNMSPFMIEREKEIFLKRFQNLSADEVYFVAKNFNDFQVRARIDEQLAQNELFKSWEAYYRTLN